MTEKHKSNGWSSYGGFHTGDPPMSSGSSKIHDQSRALLNWIKNRQIFSYMGQGPFETGLVPDTNPYRHLNPDVDFPGTTDPYFAVITKSDELDNLYHPIGGMLNAWRYSSDASISWRYSGAAAWEELFHSYHDSNEGDAHFTVGYPSVRIPLLSTPGKGPRDYGVTGGGYTYHKLKYSKLMIGGLALWTMPDTALSMDNDEWTLFIESEFGIGRQVRGSDTERAGIGNLIGSVGDIKYRTSRCLLQSGHPLGISTSSTTYVDIRTGRASAGGDASKFRVASKSLFRGATVSCTPSVVAWSPGASEETPSYVKFYSVLCGDSCEIAITSGTEAQYTAVSGLDIARLDDRIIVEAKAYSGGAVALRTYSIWED